MSRAAVFVDSSFLVAVADRDSAAHRAAGASYEQLVMRSRAAEATLVSHALAIRIAADQLASPERAGADVSRLSDLIAPIEVEPSRSDIVRLARRAIERRPSLDIAQAITLATMSRRRITAIATLDDLYAEYDVDVLAVGPLT